MAKSDIVDRLIELHNLSNSRRISKLMKEAAEEIRTLRATIKRIDPTGELTNPKEPTE